MSEDALFRICMITLPLPKMEGGNLFLSNFIRLLEPLASAMFVITGNFPEDTISDKKIHIRNLPRAPEKQSMLIKVPKFILTQLRICFHLVKVAKEAEIILFFLEGSYLLLPMLTAKLLRKRTILIATGSGPKTARQVYKERVFGMGGFIFYYVVSILEELVRRLSDRIVVDMPGLISGLGLGKYRSKISFGVTSGSPLDTRLFKPKNRPSERRTLVGFVGRISAEKGIINFVRATPLMLEQCNEIDFFIGGEGPLLNEVQEELENSYCRDSVTLAGWIPHEKLPTYLNKLKLLVIPSYTEMMCIIMWEAMACGTPVLATPVGAVPDVIKDGENGFILRDNSPQCIADSVVKTLNHPKLDEIAQAARASVDKGDTYQAATEGYQTIFKSLMK